MEKEKERDDEEKEKDRRSSQEVAKQVSFMMSQIDDAKSELEKERRIRQDAER